MSNLTNDLKQEATDKKLKVYRYYSPQERQDGLRIEEVVKSEIRNAHRQDCLCNCNPCDKFGSGCNRIRQLEIIKKNIAKLKAEYDSLSSDLTELTLIKKNLCSRFYDCNYDDEMHSAVKEFKDLMDGVAGLKDERVALLNNLGMFVDQFNHEAID